jgi:hypothetical protein
MLCINTIVKIQEVAKIWGLPTFSVVKVMF